VECNQFVDDIEVKDKQNFAYELDVKDESNVELRYRLALMINNLDDDNNEILELEEVSCSHVGTSSSAVPSTGTTSINNEGSALKSTSENDVDQDNCSSFSCPSHASPKSSVKSSFWKMDLFLDEQMMEEPEQPCKTYYRS